MALGLLQSAKSDISDGNKSGETESLKPSQLDVKAALHDLSERCCAAAIECVPTNHRVNTWLLDNKGNLIKKPSGAMVLRPVLEGSGVGPQFLVDGANRCGLTEDTLATCGKVAMLNDFLNYGTVDDVLPGFDGQPDAESRRLRPENYIG